MGPEQPVTVWTIGHSNRSFEEFVHLLEQHSIQQLVDVRAHPGSRKHPQFGTDAFDGLLRERGIAYRHSPGLGGRRRLHPDAPAALADGWHNTSFRAYAQHTRSVEFRDSLDTLREDAASSRTVICCSEAVPWRCHRWIIADVLVAGGDQVQHLLGPGQSRAHACSRFAHVVNGSISWPAETESSTVQQRDATGMRRTTIGR